MNIAAESPLNNISEPLPHAEHPVPPKPRLWSVFVVWMAGGMAGQVAILASFIVAGIVMGFAMGVQGIDAASIQVRVQEAFQQPLLAMLLTLVPFQLGMGFVVLMSAWRSTEPFRKRLGLVPPSGRKFSMLAIMAMAALTVSMALASLLVLTLLMGPPPATPVGTSVTEGSWLTMLLASLVVSLVPAIVEEIVFRGYIQRRLLERWSPVAAIGVSTLLFALIHADSLQHILAVVPLGLVTGLLAHRTGSIKQGMLLHAMHNAGTVMYMTLARMLSSQLGDEVLGMVMIASIALLALIGLPAVLMMLWHKPSSEEKSAPLPGTIASLAPELA
jgi:membrane protease YdiL (CAAX protease family)